MASMSGKVRGSATNADAELSVDSGGVANVSLNATVVSTLIPQISGGLSTFNRIATGVSLDATNVKAGPGQIYHISGYNFSTTPAWLKLYNSAGTPDVGSLAFVDMKLIPANPSGGGGGFEMEIANGIQFTTGIAIGLTVGMASADKTSVSTSSYVVSIYYK